MHRGLRGAAPPLRPRLPPLLHKAVGEAVQDEQAPQDVPHVQDRLLNVVLLGEGRLPFLNTLTRKTHTPALGIQFHNWHHIRLWEGTLAHAYYPVMDAAIVFGPDAERWKAEFKNQTAKPILNISKY